MAAITKAVPLIAASVMLLSGCGSGGAAPTVRAGYAAGVAGAPSAAPAGARTVCENATNDLRMGGATLVVAKSTHNGDLDTWMRAPDGKNDPNARVENYPALKEQSRTDPVTFCLFKVSGLSVPDPSEEVYDAMQIYVTGPGARTFAAYGTVDQMSREASTLQADDAYSAAPAPQRSVAPAHRG